jgi:hypothetical protein
MKQCLNYLHFFYTEGIHDYLVSDNKITPPAVDFMKYSMNL